MDHNSDHRIGGDLTIRQWPRVSIIARIDVLRIERFNSFNVGLFGVFPLHAMYPLMKRWSLFFPYQVL